MPGRSSTLPRWRTAWCATSSRPGTEGVTWPSQGDPASYGPDSGSTADLPLELGPDGGRIPADASVTMDGGGVNPEDAGLAAADDAGVTNDDASVVADDAGITVDDAGITVDDAGGGAVDAGQAPCDRDAGSRRRHGRCRAGF